MVIKNMSVAILEGNYSVLEQFHMGWGKQCPHVDIALIGSVENWETKFADSNNPVKFSHMWNSS